MKNDDFIKLRTSKKISQAQLAEKLFLPISSIRKWEQGKSIPSLEDMKRLANLFEVERELIFGIFKPQKTKTEIDIEEEYEIYTKLIQIFYDTNTADKFLLIANIFSTAKNIGVLIYDDYIFPFFEMISDLHGGALILIGEDRNAVVFTKRNIISVVPVSSAYNVYTFLVQVCCPIFPTDKEYISDVFLQTIKVSFYDNLLR